MLNPYSPPMKAVGDVDVAAESARPQIPQSILGWSVLGIVVHGLLALNWAFTSWVPWVIPNLIAQICVSLVGLLIHVFAFRMVKRNRWRFPLVLIRGSGTTYFLFTVCMLIASFALSASMVRRDEARYQEHLERVNETRNARSVD